LASSVINVGKIMRDEAYIQNKKRGKKYKFYISVKAVQQEISFLKAKIESDVFAACERHFNEAKRKHKMNDMKKTVTDDDIILVNGFITQPERTEVDDEG